MRFGAAVSAVVLSSVVATMPAAMRIGPLVDGSCGVASVWLALVALAFTPLALVTVTLRHALAALRLFDPRSVATAIAAVLVWGTATFVALALLGAVLRATTHHHGLAGVTFAMGGLAIAAILAVLSTRFVVWARAAAAPLRWLAVAAVSLAMGVALAFFSRILGHSDAGARLAVDLVAFAFAAAFGAGAFPHRSRPFAPLALAGPPVAAVVLFIGLGALRSSAPLRAAVREQAPILAGVLVAPGLPAAPSDGAPPH